MDSRIPDPQTGRLQASGFRLQNFQTRLPFEGSQAGGAIRGWDLISGEYIPILLDMSTSVHLPRDLLASVDHRAQELGISRNRYIIQALQQAIEGETRWSSRFVEELTAARSDDEGRRALEELATTIAANRNRKAPPAL